MLLFSKKLLNPFLVNTRFKSGVIACLFLEKLNSQQRRYDKNKITGRHYSKMTTLTHFS